MDGLLTTQRIRSNIPHENESTQFMNANQWFPALFCGRFLYTQKSTKFGKKRQNSFEHKHTFYALLFIKLLKSMSNSQPFFGFCSNEHFSCIFLERDLSFSIRYNKIYHSDQFKKQKNPKIVNSDYVIWPIAVLSKTRW